MFNKTLRASILCSVTSLLAAVSFSAQAGILANPNPTLGVDGAYAFFDFEDNYGNPIYQDDNGVVSPYVAINIWQWIGAEFGYHVLPTRDKDVRLNPGQYGQSGNPVSMLVNGTFQDTFSTRDLDVPYMALTFNYQLPKCKPISLFGALGAGYARLMAEEYPTGTDLGLLAPNLIVAATREFEETKGVFMARVGGSLMVHENIGVRIFGEYLNTSRLSVQSKQVNGAGVPAEIKLDDTYLFGAGIFVTNVI